METQHAVNEEKQKLWDARFGLIDKRLDRIDGLIARLAWLIIAAIIGSLMSFVMMGGFPSL
ncbi:MAG: hypothetical protein AAGF30_01090 [Pseudomonadota bacterium]